MVWQAMFTHVCVAIEDGCGADRAVAAGAGLARACGARLTLATVVAPVDEPLRELGEWLLPGRPDTDAQLALERRARALAGDLDVTVRVLSGRRTAELRALAAWDRPDVVVASRWRRSLAAALVCPLLVVGDGCVTIQHRKRANRPLIGGPAAFA